LTPAEIAVYVLGCAFAAHLKPGRSPSPPPIKKLWNLWNFSIWFTTRIAKALLTTAWWGGLRSFGSGCD